MHNLRPRIDVSSQPASHCLEMKSIFRLFTAVVYHTQMKLVIRLLVRLPHEVQSNLPAGAHMRYAALYLLLFTDLSRLVQCVWCLMDNCIAQTNKLGIGKTNWARLREWERKCRWMPAPLWYASETALWIYKKHCHNLLRDEVLQRQNQVLCAFVTGVENVCQPLQRSNLKPKPNNHSRSFLSTNIPIDRKINTSLTIVSQEAVSYQSVDTKLSISSNYSK